MSALGRMAGLKRLVLFTLLMSQMQGRISILFHHLFDESNARQNEQSVATGLNSTIAVLITFPMWKSGVILMILDLQ
eukprot:8244106-Ditylum_brightwellii.AAC.1